MLYRDTTYSLPRQRFTGFLLLLKQASEIFDVALLKASSTLVLPRTFILRMNHHTRKSPKKQCQLLGSTSCFMNRSFRHVCPRTYIMKRPMCIFLYTFQTFRDCQNNLLRMLWTTASLLRY